jgi:hypothetical protein
VAASRTLSSLQPSLARLAIGRLASALLFVFALLLAPIAHADAPVDVATEDGAAARSALPSLPEGFVRERRGEVRWEYPQQARSVARELQQTYRAAWPRVTGELGGDIDAELVIRIGTNPSEMRRLAPREAPPPAYASGVAYPARGLVLLTLSAPETWERPDVDSVLVHELSHIALHRAVNGQPIPRWFSEGVAIHQAREHDMERIRALWSATVGDRLIPIGRLSRAFSDRPHRVTLAYAESADFVRWLHAREDGDDRFHELIGRVARGSAFEVAVERTYSTDLRDLELAWHDDLSERYEAWPLLLGSGGLWVLAALLIVVAYFRRRRRDRVKIAQWEDEDRAALAAARLVAVQSAGPDQAGEEREVLYVLPPEPRLRDSGVPTIEHEGRSHTLH